MNTIDKSTGPIRGLSVHLRTDVLYRTLESNSFISLIIPNGPGSYSAAELGGRSARSAAPVISSHKWYSFLELDGRFADGLN